MTNKSAREQALNVLYRVDTQNAYATQLLDHISRDATIDDRDRALIQQLVKGTLVWRGRIDSILESLVKGGTRQLTPWIRNILRLGVYQILFLDRVPPHVAVNEAVNLAKRYGHPGTVKLVNAVLRKTAAQAPALLSASSEHDPIRAIATQHSHPEWLVRRWMQQLGVDETIALCAANNQPWPPCVRTNTLRTGTPQLRQAFAALELAWHAAAYDGDCTILDGLPRAMRLHHLPPYDQGLFQVQDESFALVSRLADPQPGEFVVDLCSAPGGKTTHMAALMHNQGRIAAVDIHEHRLALVRDNCARLGVTIVETIEADGRTLQLDRPADRVLLDAPCSGTGVLGRRSDARWNKAEEDLPGLQALQRELLDHAATLVRPGGELIYATCTLEPEENDEQIAAFLGRFPDYRRIELAGRVPPELIDQQGYYRTWPQRHGMGGAFGAVLRREQP